MRSFALVWVLAACVAAGGRMTQEEALTALSSPETMCDGAAVLAKAGEVSALMPLARAYASRAEGSHRVCLLDAMDKLGAAAGVPASWASAATADDRYVVLQLASWFPSDAALPVLEAAVADPDARTRFLVLRAVGLQLRTPAWAALCERWLAHADAPVRLAAVEALAGRPESAAALKARIAVEPDAKIKAKLEMLVGD